jgi:hypothetical protein
MVSTSLTAQQTSPLGKGSPIVRPTTITGRSSTRLLLVLLAAFGLLVSLMVTARPAHAGEVGAGTIAIFKTMCESIGQQDTCNGRDKTLAGYHIDYTITNTDTDALVQTITLTLGENAGGGGNTGGGSQGRIESDPLVVGTYTVCEAPDGAPIAYLDGHDDVLLDALPRPEPGNGGSSGGGQVQDGACIVVEVTTGTAELKFLDQQVEPEGTGSIEVLKTDDGEPAAALAGAEFTVEGFADSFTTGADGTFCVDGLELDSTVTVTETVPPTGFELADPASQEVTVTVEGMCDEREGGPDATFVNSAATATPTQTPNEGELGGNPTPTPEAEVPDTATAGLADQVPSLVLSLLLVGSLLTLAYIRMAGQRR